MKPLQFIQLVGPSACGKSTYLKNNYRNFVIVCLDDIRRIFYGHQYHANAEGYVRTDAKNIVRMLLSQGKSVVLDSTALTLEIRLEWRHLAEEYNAKYSIVFFDISKKECLRRDALRPEGKSVGANIIDRQFSQLNRPVFSKIGGEFSHFNGENYKIKVKVIHEKENSTRRAD